MSSTNIHRPFTYLLINRITNQRYYGVRYAKGCQPSDLWSIYFSSSKVVKKLIELYGKDSFSYQVRREFNTAEEALIWEAKVQRRLDLANNPNWLNRHNNREKFRSPNQHSEKTKETIRKSVLGMKRREETKRKLSESALKRERLRRESGWQMPRESVNRSQETRKRRIEQGLINPYSEDRNKKMGASKRGKKRSYLPNGKFIMI